MSNNLSLKFDPRTIEHLGIKMYSRLPSALAELIANAYDANATEVNVELFDSENNMKVVVSDNGDGMSFEEINDNFLVIGRKRRDFDDNLSILNRKITGRKGLGKLALFGIGKTIEINTCKSDSNQMVKFTMNWEHIINEKSGEYHPLYELASVDSATLHGTSITVSDLKRTSIFNLDQLVLSLSKLFNFFDENFKVFVAKNYSQKRLITKEDRIEGIDEQYVWDVREIIKDKNPDFPYKDCIQGKIISSKKPLRPELRGITLYARGRQANEASFFGLSEAGHTFSYVTGWIEADYIDDENEDYISTDRQMIDWDSPITLELQKTLQIVLRFIVQDWSNRRSKDKIEKISDRTSINVSDWLSKVPIDVKGKLERIISSVSKEPQVSDEMFDSFVLDINKLIPEYTYYHYRMLSSEIQSVSKKHYEQKNYYFAFQEALKRYKNKVQQKSGTAQSDDLSIMSNSFGISHLLSVADGFLKPDGRHFTQKTLENIEEGQKHLSMGIVQGGRNVLSHEEMTDLQQSGLFTEKDCLDFLSLLSHLFKRLEQSKKR
jgi:uncharacterized protein (TIGR02391 family)